MSCADCRILVGRAQVRADLVPYWRRQVRRGDMNRRRILLVAIAIGIAVAFAAVISTAVRDSEKPASPAGDEAAMRTTIVACELQQEPLVRADGEWKITKVVRDLNGSA